jgi:hypothetical protein
MYPNQPPQQPPQAPTPPSYPMQPSTGTPLPTDYLNQIAPQAPKKALFSFGIRQIALIGAALVVLVIILSIVTNALVGSNKTPLEHLAARITTTQTVVNNAQGNLKSSELRSLNSNLKLYMTNTTRDMAAPLLSAGVNTTKISAGVTAAESTTALSARLEDARLNAVFDRTYAREMAYQLGTMLTLISQDYKATSNMKLQTFLKSAYDNLKPTQESFANFTTTN